MLQVWSCGAAHVPKTSTSCHLRALAPACFQTPSLPGMQDVFRSEDAVLDTSRFAQLDELLSKTDLYTKFLRLVLCLCKVILVG